MNFLHFLNQTSHSNFFNTKPLILFQGSGDYPLLFFSFLIKKLKSQKIITETINLSQEDSATVKARLETSFLGLPVFYWLRNVTDLPAQKRVHWLDYIQQYNGSNTIACFIDKTQPLQLSNKELVITMPSKVDQALFIALMKFFDRPLSKRNMQIITTLYKRNEALTLDSACILMYYLTMVGASINHFMNDWLDALVVPEKSLFLLSQYFFAKDSQQFFKRWSTIVHDYMPAFWSSFWSEQIWRACNFVKLTRNKKNAEAKNIGFRLPFAFLRRDWQQYTCTELSNAHQFIYAMDFRLKNGGIPFSFDLFYAKFFLNEFKT